MSLSVLNGDFWSKEQLEKLTDDERTHLLEANIGSFKEFKSVHEEHLKVEADRIAKAKRNEHIGKITECRDCNSIARKLGLNRGKPKRYKVWMKVEVDYGNDDFEDIEDSEVSLGEFGTEAEAECIMNRLHDIWFQPYNREDEQV